ncbi:MAG: hypothetical protein K1X79_04170 [Oligoflexia bacterium]|nr:hypothetical protein [Oligoflexia bacterium]
MTPPPRPLASRQTAEQDDTLGGTAEVFASRMQRRLKEQEARESESKKAQATRQTLLLEAMTMVRKALSSTSRIALGDRFHFSVDVSDWDGWPRVELVLADRLAPNKSDHSLVITAFDRKGSGTIQMGLRSGETLARIHVDQAADMEKLPLLLKKTVREFLDIVADYVLNPKSPQEMLEVQTKAIVHSTFDANAQSETKGSLNHEELFGEESEENSNQVDRVQQLTPIDM